MIEERNQTLIKDNAKLLQRWLDAKQAEANKMNEANEFYEDMQSKRQAMGQKPVNNSTEDSVDGQSSVSHGSGSGNGQEKRASGPQTKKDGIPSPGQKAVNLTPNG